METSRDALRRHVLAAGEASSRPVRSSRLTSSAAERPDALGEHELGHHLADPDIEIRASFAPCQAPTSRRRPSWEISRDSMATLLCAALRAGPTHFIGTPLTNFQTFTGRRASFIRTISPSLRLPFARTKPLCQVQRSS